MNRTLSILIVLACVCSPLIDLRIQASDLPTKNALSKQKQIEGIAKKITVRVFAEQSPKDGASGILIQKQQQIQGQRSIYLYLVLTNKHVVEFLTHKAQSLGGGYQIQTFDGVDKAGEVHKAFLYQKANFGGNDLGLLWFSSTNNYQVAQQGRSQSLNEYDQIFVAGFPIDKQSSEEEAFTLTSGRAATSLIISNKPLDAGYQLGFSNQTSDGMSGGPVLDEAGRLVGINGRGKNQQQIFLSPDPRLGNSNPYGYFGGKGEPSAETQRWMRHFAWGIPIETYKKLAPPKPFDELQSQLQASVLLRTPTASSSPSLSPQSTPSSKSNTDALKESQKILGIALLLIMGGGSFVFGASKLFRRTQQHTKSKPDTSPLETSPVLPLAPPDLVEHPQPLVEVIVNNSRREVKMLFNRDSLLFAGNNCERNVQINGNPDITVIRTIPEYGRIIPKTQDDKTYKFQFDTSKGKTSKNSAQDEEYWYLLPVENGSEKSCRSIQIEFTKDENVINKG
ncbi:serine protease [Aetokthonos hydrillicola Thurmond2011]|jgi:hypothetical protein|uniref:Serine protease n=1 Tax=Aetokthonos hydrillicola Thurmond2011 TaxID=2712845 RepID=A0AAP5IB14_9CYAN|nr:serine protease [Aetokthonos hydrillicola]MBO3460435.1 trypsin-like peptidase domain-containing protein [Aetokthonos hydrillicola CCALA 1050]MBW4588489.1 serine protease [Aetokthonos hydrillicola CCALA 1050]MDR9896817.1 serine protease [Aetokthonos hydrillicola Thurmond2011]